MTSVSELHLQAMNLVDQAMVERRDGKEETAANLFTQATELELAALEAMQERVQPSYSILQRSAASMAMNANRLDQAEEIINQALSQDPHPAIAEEMRAVLDQVKFRKQLAERSSRLDRSNLQLDLLPGESSKTANANFPEVSKRLNCLEYLVTRTLQRIRGMAYKQRPSERLPQLPSPQMEPTNGHIHRPVHMGFEKNVTTLSGYIRVPHSAATSEVIYEVIAAMDTLNRSGLVGLRNRITDIQYLGHFLFFARRIAPDGQLIREVGLSSNAEIGRSVIITRTRSDIPLRVAEL